MAALTLDRSADEAGDWRLQTAATETLAAETLAITAEFTSLGNTRADASSAEARQLPSVNAQTAILVQKRGTPHCSENPR
jgi:hypothetical protein